MLVQAVLAGDHECFGAIIVRHDVMVRRAVRRSVQSHFDLEEAVQETWCLSFKRLSDLVQPSRLAGWLAAIAVNCGREQRRRIDRLVDPLPAVELQTPVSENDQEWLWDLVRSMPEKFSQVLSLHYRDGATYDEIALTLGLPRSTVRGRIYHARRDLRRRIEEKS
jgi:RNA polymerase sigma-70 factor (ECF subfamily)